jgi:hypothetical protein
LTATRTRAPITLANGVGCSLEAFKNAYLPAINVLGGKRIAVLRDKAEVRLAVGDIKEMPSAGLRFTFSLFRHAIPQPLLEIDSARFGNNPTRSLVFDELSHPR